MLLFLYLGSSGDTEAQFHEPLFPNFPRGKIVDLQDAFVKDQPGFRTLSAWWVDPETPLAPVFREQGEQKWGITFHTHNFGVGAVESTMEINKWFSTRTNNRVPQVLTPLDLTGRETAVAVSVSAFAGRWSGFAERDTVEERFHFSEQEKGAPFGEPPPPPPAKPFIANHPFAFFLYEKGSRRILFAGTVEHPDQFP